MGLIRMFIFLTGASLVFGGDFIAPDALDPRVIVPPPPASDSITQEADEATVLNYSRNLTPAQVALARHWEKYDAFNLLRPVIGDWASPQTLPKLAAFLQKSTGETRPFTDTVKKLYARPRPHLAMPTFQPLLGKPDSSSYPSGHSTGAALHSTLFAAILPDHAVEFAHQAELVRLSRLYGGVHFPTDVVAGRRLGEAIAAAMLKSPQTQQAIEEIRQEIAAAIAAHQKAA